MATTSGHGGEPVRSPRSFALQHQRPKSSFVGCSKIADYELLGKLGEGTFGEVHKARSRRSGGLFAMKKIIMHNEKDGFPITALREIKLLKLLSHQNVLRLEDMAVEHPPSRGDKRKRPIMYMVTPYMDHDLSGLLDNPSVHFTEPQIKCYLLQLLEGLKYLHENHILHRDMKAANLLISNQGILQIADFGLARHYTGSVPRPGQGGGEGEREYTSLVVTRWYRPPELLMHLKRYTTAIDMWGVGCVFGEMLVGKPILSGESDAHQLDLIFDLCGTPTDENMPDWKSLPGTEHLTPRSRNGNLTQRFRQYGSGAISLLKELLRLDWKTRTNAMDALQHPYFRTAPLPAKPADIPTFEDSHELDRRKFHDRRAVLPPAPKGGTVGRGAGQGGHGPNGPNGSFENGDGFGSRNGANGRAPHGQRNGPPAAPPDDRRQPAWHRDLGLPPRPPPPLDQGQGLDGSNDHRDSRRDRDIDRVPRHRAIGGRGGGGGGGAGGAGGGGADNIDTYIPTYEGQGARRPPLDERRRRDEHEDRRHDWDRERDRNRGRLEYDDRARNSRTRSRSRSPPRRDREWDRERDRDRDWDRDRDRDGYRR